MGVVYSAVDLQSNRRVAVKVLRRGDADPALAASALEREALAMTLVGGSRVPAVYGVDVCCGQPCLVMERLVGCTLKDRLRTGPMDMQTAIDLAIQIAEALERIHRAGLMHLDIKPANVFITETGRVKILDFGLATPIDDRGAGAAAQRPAEEVLGTASYISPERILRAPVDERSDLFSLGTVLYEMAFGRSPFAASTPAESIFNVLESDPPAVAPQSDIAVGIHRLVRLLLEKNPARRCQSAADARRALTSLRTLRPRRARRFTINRLLHMRGSRHASVHVDLH